MHSVRQQSLTTLEDLNTQSGIGLAFFYRRSKLHYRTSVTLMNLSCCVLWWWKNCDLSVPAYRKCTLFFINRKKQIVPIKNLAANVNHIIVTRLREVYSFLGWLPLGCHDPEAAESVGTKFSANVTIKVSLSCNTVPKITFTGKKST